MRRSRLVQAKNDGCFKHAPRGLILRVPWVFAALLLVACASQSARRSDDHLARVELLALLQTFNADLLSHDSATATLERWCADHRLADPARIVAQRGHDADKPIPDALRTKLAIDAAELLRYRHVQLACGGHVLSEADNWYVPARLTAEMNRQLDTTDEPFGKVVRPLGFQRRTLSVELLWTPLPARWEMSAQSAAAAPNESALRVPHDVLRHQAILYTSAQQPFSAVVETYTSAIFDFASWSAYVKPQ
jgi:chorismate-pyruvate lyase